MDFIKGHYDWANIDYADLSILDNSFFFSQIDWRIQSLKVIKFLKQQLVNNKNKILAKINLLEEHNQNLAKLKIVVLMLYQIYHVDI